MKEDQEREADRGEDRAWPEPPCTASDHYEWTMLAGRRGLYCSYCGATIPAPVAAVGVRLVPIE